MGGLYECASNGIPIIPLPFLLSADQPVNAKAAEAAGFAVRPRLSWVARWWQKRSPGEDPQFPASAIREAVDRAITNPSLLEGAQRAKLAVLASAYGRVAVDAVESA